MSAVTTHVLDAVLGRPAAGVAVQLHRVERDEVLLIAEGETDHDGRLRDLGPDQVPAGTYRITFDTGAWFEAAGRATFYPQVAVTFTVSEDHQHCHVPVLLSPFAFSTYRGS